MLTLEEFEVYKQSQLETIETLKQTVEAMQTEQLKVQDEQKRAASVVEGLKNDLGVSNSNLQLQEEAVRERKDDAIGVGCAGAVEGAREHGPDQRREDDDVGRELPSPSRLRWRD